MRWVSLKLLDTAVSGTVEHVLSTLSACTHHTKLRHTAVSALSVSRLWFELYYAARVRRCGVLRSCVHSRCGLRALSVVHWKGGGFPLDLLDKAGSALVLLCC